MKSCQAHWDAIKDAVSIRDMDGLVSPNGTVALERLVLGERGGDAAKDSFDPLMGAWFAIMGEALRCGGPYLLNPRDDGTEYCPLCELANHGGDADQWINGAADEQLMSARKLGLAPQVN